MGVATLVYDDTPPSVNTNRLRNWRGQNREKRKWQAILETLLMASEMPRGVARVEAEAVLRFPVKRRRDESNHRWLLDKALGDALTNGGWLRDDTPDFYRFDRVRFDSGPPTTTVTLQWRLL